MKKLSAFLCFVMIIMMVVPSVAFGASTYIIENDPVTMPKATPTIDGVLTNDYWSEPAYYDEDTAGHFWAGNKLTSYAELYFAYDDTYLYFAADIEDNDAASGFVVSTDFDTVDGSYGWDGDVMTLMLDPLGLFEKASPSYSPWYSIGIFEDESVAIYSSRGNTGEITEDCLTAGKITDDGWLFEVAIPWTIIAGDIRVASGNSLSATAAQCAVMDSVHRAAAMYMDRMEGMTWGRYITVCDTSYDGNKGIYSGGTQPKYYGLTLINGPVGHTHSWTEWRTINPATCTEDGLQERNCETCEAYETQVVTATGHGNYYYETVPVTCTVNGAYITYCGNCDEELDRDIIQAPGHQFSEWTTVTQPTAVKAGLKERVCSVCTYKEEEIIPALNAPTFTINNYDLIFSNASNIEYIRIAPGILTTSADIKNSPNLVSYNKRLITEGTFQDEFTLTTKQGGVYSLWIKMSDGQAYIESFDNTQMQQSVHSDGLTVYVDNLSGVKDFFIAEGQYDTYRDVANNQLVRISQNKIGDKHDYKYVVKEPGYHTVLIRYTDESRPNEIYQLDVTVTYPSFVADGHMITIGNLYGAKSVRAVYGDYQTPGDIKRAEGSIGYAQSKLQGKEDAFSLTFKNNGLVSVSVEYLTGYWEVFQFESREKTPKYRVGGKSVAFRDLDGLQILRWAKGNLNSAADIKATKGNKYIKEASVVDGDYTVENLEEDTLYTFMVQYVDGSCQFYHFTTSYVPMELANIGTQRQVMVEDYSIDWDYSSNITFDYVAPKKENMVFKFDSPLETTDAVYHNISKAPDGTYRMYYKATGNTRRICYITSTDGLTWTRPQIKSYRYSDGKYYNSVTSNSGSLDNLFVFYDTNPNCPENQRWKGFYGEWGSGLFLEYSATGDGNKFDFASGRSIQIMGSPSQTNGAFYDSLNTVYYDSAKGKYVALVRGFHEGDNYNLTKEYVAENGMLVTRDIRYSESTDCLHWTTPVPITYSDDNDWQMYTNAVVPYFRASQVYVGMPTRYRYVTGKSNPQTDVFLMSSRDLQNWERSEEPYLTPNGTGTTYEYGESGYPGIGYIQTSDTQMSFYMKEKSNTYNCMVLYRYSLRLDGFRAAKGTGEDSVITTKDFQLQGTKLYANYDTGANGKMRVTVTDTYGNQVQSNWFTGNAVDGEIPFTSDLSALNGHYVTVKFELDNTSLYSYVVG